MSIFDHLGNTLRTLRTYLFGKGVMTLAVAAAYASSGVGWVLALVAIGGVVLTAMNRFFGERRYEDGMVDLYRNDLATQFGIAPEQVTRGHLKEAAKSNDVIDQALKRQRNKTFLAIGTAAMASVTTVLLFNAFGSTSALKQFAGSILGSTGLASFANYVGIGTLAAISGLIFKGGLQTVVGATTGISKAAANDRIIELDWQVKRGHAVTKEQVYGVLVAGDPKLQVAIAHRFRKPYGNMRPHEQDAVLRAVGVNDAMQQIATQINRGEIRPSRLAYLMQEADNVSHGQPAVADAEASAPPRANFVERLGLAPNSSRSFGDQLAAECQSAFEHGAQR